jgi:dynein heavy chain
VDPTEVGWRPYVRTWLDRLAGVNTLPELSALLWQLFDEHLDNAFKFIRKSLVQVLAPKPLCIPVRASPHRIRPAVLYPMQTIPQVDLGKTATLCKLFEQLLTTKIALCKPEEYDAERDRLYAAVANIFFFAFVWGVGGNLQQQSHDKFDSFVRDAFRFPSSKHKKQGEQGEKRGKK